jgi:hypothetical protein
MNDARVRRPWLKWAGMTVLAFVALWAAITWNLCEWHCYKLDRFAALTTDGCRCLPPSSSQR